MVTQVKHGGFLTKDSRGIPVGGLIKFIEIFHRLLELCFVYTECRNKKNDFGCMIFQVMVYDIPVIIECFHV